MIYLNKLLPMFFSPLLLTLLLVVIGTLTRRRWITFSGMLLLYCASAPFIAHPLFRYAENHAIRLSPQEAPRADAIIVLGGMLQNTESTSGVVTEWRDPDRFFGGVDLYKLGKASKLVFTGGKLPWETADTNEGVTLKRYAETMGVPPKDILVSGEVQNTEQEARAVGELFREGTPTIILVTSAFHMPRAKLLFENEGFTVHEYPVDFKVSADATKPMDFIPQSEALIMTQNAIREQLGLLFYRLKHLLSDSKKPHTPLKAAGLSHPSPTHI